MDNGGGGSRTAEMSSMQASKRRAAESGWENVPKGKHARYNDPYDGIGHVQWTLKQFQPEAPGSKVAKCLHCGPKSGRYENIHQVRMQAHLVFCHGFAHPAVHVEGRFESWRGLVETLAPSGCNSERKRRKLEEYKEQVEKFQTQKTSGDDASEGSQAAWERIRKHARAIDPYDGIGRVQWTCKQFQPEVPGSKAVKCIHCGPKSGTFQFIHQVRMQAHLVFCHGFAHPPDHVDGRYDSWCGLVETLAPSGCNSAKKRHKLTQFKEQVIQYRQLQRDLGSRGLDNGDAESECSLASLHSPPSRASSLSRASNTTPVDHNQI